MYIKQLLHLIFQSMFLSFFFPSFCHSYICSHLLPIFLPSFPHTLPFSPPPSLPPSIPPPPMYSCYLQLLPISTCFLSNSQQHHIRSSPRLSAAARQPPASVQHRGPSWWPGTTAAWGWWPQRGSDSLSEGTYSDPWPRLCPAQQ